MNVVTAIPIEILHVFNDAGTAVKGASITEAYFIDGVFWRQEVKHLDDSTLAGVRDFQLAFNSAMVKERDELKASLAAMAKAMQETTTALETTTAAKNDLAAEVVSVSLEMATAKEAAKVEQKALSEVIQAAALQITQLRDVAAKQ